MPSSDSATLTEANKAGQSIFASVTQLEHEADTDSLTASLQGEDWHYLGCRGGDKRVSRRSAHPAAPPAPPADGRQPDTALLDQ